MISLTQFPNRSWAMTALLINVILTSSFGAEYLLVFAGQSNMQGKGTSNAPLPLNLQHPVTNVYGFYTNGYDKVGGSPDVYGGDLYPATNGYGFLFNWATAKNSSAHFAGGTWQPYSFWKSSWTGRSRTGAFNYVKGSISAEYWYIGLNPGEPWSNANTFHTGEPVQEYGPEFTAVMKLHESRPNDVFYIVKYAPGGTSLAVDWNAQSGPCYAAMRDWVQCAMDARPSAKFAGFFWLQGESDAINPNTHALSYEVNLKNLISHLRIDFNVPELPIIIGKIHPGDPARNYGQVLCSSTAGITAVRSAQDAVATSDPTTIKSIETADLHLLHAEWNQRKVQHSPVVPPNHKDDAVLDDMMTGAFNAPLHFNPSGIQAIGERMAQAWLSISQSEPIKISPAVLPACNLNAPMSQQLTASGGTGPYSFTVSEGQLPPGLMLNIHGLLSGTPTNAGVYRATITVNDALSNTSSETFDIHINTTNINTPVKLCFLTQPPFELLEGSPIPAIQIAIQDAAGNTVSSSNETVFLSLGNNTANASLSGIRTVQAINGIATFTDLYVDRVGAVFVLIAQSNSYSTAYSSVFNVISPNPVIHSALEPLNSPVTVGQAASFVIGVSSNFGNTFEWNWGDGSTTSTTVPNATHSYSTAGLFNVTVTISNELGRTLLQTLMLNVVPNYADENASGPGMSPNSFEVTSLRIQWNHRTSGQDFAKMKATLPFDEGFTPNDLTVQWNIGGHSGSAPVGSNSKPDSHSKAALRIKSSRRGTNSQVAYLQVTIRGVLQKIMKLKNFESLDSNSLNKKGDPAAVEVSVILTGYKAFGPSLIPGTFRGKMGIKSSFRK